METDTRSKTDEDENYAFPDLTKICRLCLEENSGTVNIFEQTEMSIPVRILACTSLEVVSSDSLPKHICTECRIQLERSYYFRKKALHSDRKLRKHVLFIKAGKRSNVFSKENEDFEEFEYTDSLEFLKNVENEEKRKQRLEKEKFTNKLKDKFREEETSRLFDEVKRFFLNKSPIKPDDKHSKKTISKTNEKSIESIHHVSIKKENLEEDVSRTQFKNDKKVDIKRSQNDERNNQFEEVAEDLKNEKSASEEVTSVKSSENYIKFVLNEENSEIDSPTNSVSAECYVLKDVNEDNEEPYNRETRKSLDEITITFADNSDAESETERDSEMIEDPLREMQSSNMYTDTYSIEEVMNVDENNDQNNINEQEDSDYGKLEEISSMNDGESSNQSQSQLALASIVQNTLISQEHLKPNGNFTFKVTKVSDNGKTHIKVETDEGNIIHMELQIEDTSIKSDNEENDDKDSTIFKKVISPDTQETKIFKCDQCPQAFSRMSLLTRHSSVHIKAKGYCCTYCKKWFACKSSLDRHARVHTGEKPFKCEECGKSFIQKEILKRHMAIHTGQRPYACPHCDKSFVQKQLLRKHINLKHTDNPVVEMHECFLCPKTFCHASGLSRHLLVHSGVSYNCTICGKKFNDRSAVKRHAKAVHGKKDDKESDSTEISLKE